MRRTHGGHGAHGGGGGADFWASGPCALGGLGASCTAADPLWTSTDLAPPLTPGRGAPDESDGPMLRTITGTHTVVNHGKGSENQDAFVSSSSSSGTKSLIGVFDGHGEQGGRVSQFCSVQIAKSLFNHMELHTNPVAALENAFLDTQQKIERSHNFDAFHSGSTAVAAYRHRNRLYVANCGDSRAVLGCSSARGSGDNGLKAVDLSSDHRPDRADERKRILDEGGTVHQSTIPVRQGFGAPPRFMRVGPERVWDRTGRCGLCVTRSMGDLSMRPWVTAIPEVTERELTPKDKFIILGSDGVWDRLASQEAVDITARHRDPTAAAREIVTVARQRWHQQTQGQMSDDITAVVMHLDYGGSTGTTPPQTQGSSRGTPGLTPSAAPGMPPAVPPVPSAAVAAGERLPNTDERGRRGRYRGTDELAKPVPSPRRPTGGARATSSGGQRVSNVRPPEAPIFSGTASLPVPSGELRASSAKSGAGIGGLDRLPPMIAPTNSGGPNRTTRQSRGRR